MIIATGIAKLLPGFDGDATAAANEYRKFGNANGTYAALELRHGAVAIEIEPLVE